MRRYLIIFLLGCSSPLAPSPKMDDSCNRDVCEVDGPGLTHQQECDDCWRECGQATSFNEALICSMRCTAVCAPGDR